MVVGLDADRGPSPRKLMERWAKEAADEYAYDVDLAVDAKNGLAYLLDMLSLSADPNQPIHPEAIEEAATKLLDRLRWLELRRVHALRLRQHLESFPKARTGTEVTP